MTARKVLKDTGEVINFEPMMTKERDSRELCGSRHEVMVGVTEAIDGELTPFEDYFIVFFRPQDTSGGGKIMNAIGAAVLVLVDTGDALFRDPEKYADVTNTGREIMEQKRKDGDAGWLEYNTYVVLDETIGNLWRWGGSAETDFSRYEAESPFYTPYGMKSQQFAVEDESINCDDWWYEMTGGCYHALQGGKHKIRVIITCTYDGTTITKYDSEIAGCDAQYEEGTDCINGEVYQRFAINSPGLWKISIRPIATGSCNMLSYQVDEEYEVVEPDDWKPSAIFTMTNEISRDLQDAGIPISVTPLKLVAGASLLGGLLLLKIFKKKKAKSA